MNRRSSDDVPANELAARLTADASGIWEHEGAIRLLVEQGSWLENRDFRKYILSEEMPNDVVARAVAWGEVGSDLKQGLIGGAQEDLLVLKIAVSLTGFFSIPLREIENVSPRTTRAIMRAIATSAGYGSAVDRWCPLG